MKKKSKILIAIFVVLFLIIGLIVGSIIYVKSSLKPTKQFLNGEICKEDSPCETTAFVVDEGAYGKSTLVKLQEENIIKNADLAYYYNRLISGYSFVAGYFEIPHQVIDYDGTVRDINLEEIMAFIADPKNAHQDTVTLSFDEGGLITDYAKIIGDNTTVTEKEIFDYWNDESVIRSYMNEYPFLTEDIFKPDVRYYLEGYLFPDTYEFFEFTNCDEVTRRFLDRTMEVYTEYKNDFDKSPFTINEVFTLASIVQGETGNFNDAPLVAGVFVDRYNEPEVLASSVTSCYAWELNAEQCYSYGESTDYTWRDHPYNTYTNIGFPPGPVCAPSKVSIHAALNPDTTEGYFFFVADLCNGGTAFARTEAEHQYNIDHYYLACMN